MKNGPPRIVPEKKREKKGYARSMPTRQYNLIRHSVTDRELEVGIVSSDEDGKLSKVK